MEKKKKKKKKKLSFAFFFKKKGMKYDLPVFMINEPAYFEVSALEKE